MKLPQIPYDDLTDVMELTDKLESSITEILDGHQENIGFSALTSATINCILTQCHTMNDILFHRDIFVQILDSCIQDVLIKEKDKDKKDPTS